MNPGEGIGFVFSSSVRGVVGSLSVSSASLSNDEITTSSPIEVLPGELFQVWIRGEENGTIPTPVEIQNISMSLLNLTSTPPRSWLGNNGFIASHLSKELGKYIKGCDIKGIGREDFNLTNREETDKFFLNRYYDVIIHTAIVGGSRLREDDSEVFYQNLSMFYNLLSNQDKFGQLRSLGSWLGNIYQFLLY